MATALLPPRFAVPRELRGLWPVAVGLLLLVVPTFISLARDVWSTEAGVHGPIVLATGAWLVVRAWPAARPDLVRGSPAIGGAVLIGSLLLYVVGRAFDFISIEVAALLGVMVGIAYMLLGGAVIRRLWFPIFYLGFLIPLPGALVDQVTAPLKTFVSFAVTEGLHAAGYPIVREGVALYVAQYQLLVEDACAGLNSIVSLTAISLFYIYLLHNASWRYSLFLMLWILPVAIFANLVRVTILVLLTYYFGNAVAQGYAHDGAGLVMFVTALLGIFLVDGLMSPVRRRLTREAQ